MAKLKDKHAGMFSEGKLRMWGHLIQMGKHASYDDPPNLLFFRGHKSATRSPAIVKEGVPWSDTGGSCVSSVSMSPGKRLQMRSQCIEQLDQWHTLLEKGGITQEQYDELQGKIFADMQM